MAYETTTVPVSRSQESIRDLLRHHGATTISFAEQFLDDTSDPGKAGSAGVEFVHDDTKVRVFVSIKSPDPKAVRDKVKRARSKTEEQIVAELVEQEARRIWRVLHWTLKARMEAVAENVETFEQAFLPHIVDPATNVTLWERIRGVVEAGALRIGGPGLRALEAGGQQ